MKAVRDVIKVEGLRKEFVRQGRDGKTVHKVAVDGLSFEINKGEIFGLYVKTH